MVANDGWGEGSGGCGAWEKVAAGKKNNKGKKTRADTTNEEGLGTAD
jgi:hypothetical protein